MPTAKTIGPGQLANFMPGAPCRCRAGTGTVRAGTGTVGCEEISVWGEIARPKRENFEVVTPFYEISFEI